MTININGIERAMIVASLHLAKKVTYDAAEKALYDGNTISYHKLIDYAADLDVLKNRFCEENKL